MFKCHFLTFILGLFTFQAFGQISMADSSVQTIAYWENGESHSFSVQLDEFRVVGSDTLDRIRTTYSLDMLVMDSTEKSYDVRWTYRDMKIEWSDQDSLIKAIFDKTLQIKGGEVVDFRTDEYGKFLEMTNWEQIRNYYQIVQENLEEEFSGIPEITQLLKNMFGIYSNRSAIEKGVIKDVYQFLNFHGGNYFLGQPTTGNITYPGVVSNQPLDAEVYVELDQIYPEDNDYGIYSSIEVNPEQLKGETVKVLAKLMPNATEAELAELMTQAGEIWNITENFSVIHGSGWPTYSKETRQTGSKQSVKFEIRIIEMI